MFQQLDRESKGYLTAKDMRPFAEQTGFSGSDQEWSSEFALLCEQFGSSQCILLDDFVKLVNDSSDAGCYCSDSELRNLQQAQPQIAAPTAPPVKAAPTAPTQAAQACTGQTVLTRFCLVAGLKLFLWIISPWQDPRRELIEVVFRALDSGGKGYLTARDMRPFAEQTGFSGSDQEWQQEFDLLVSDLCPGTGSLHGQGILLDGFASLVNDSSDEGCYVLDSDLRALPNRLQPLSQAPAVTQHSVREPASQAPQDLSMNGNLACRYLQWLFQVRRS